MWATLLSKIIPYKWWIIGIAFALVLGFASIQTYRIDSYQNEVAAYKSEISTLKDNEVKYLATIDFQKGTIGDMQELVEANEKAFQDYVRANKDRVQIIKEAQVVYVEKGQENTIGIVDTATSDKIKAFFSNEFSDLQKQLEGQK